jgi:hypothetical protein
MIEPIVSEEEAVSRDDGKTRNAEASFQMLANMARRETEKAVLAKTLRWFVSSVCEEEKVRIREMSGRGRDERGCREGMQKRSERIVYGCLVGRRKACSG